MIVIRGGRALIGVELRNADVGIASDRRSGVLSLAPAGPIELQLDARGLLVLPGLVDIHGDAFERQIMPRPGVGFDLDIALAENDRQLIANGITTAHLGLTWSWEPGPRSAGPARALVDALEQLRPRLACDVRLHLRHETYNLDAEPQIMSWLEAGRISLLAFNDHLAGTITARSRPEKKRGMVERTGLSEADFDRLVDTVCARGPEVPGSIQRLAAAAAKAAVPTLSHDDLSLAMRGQYRDLGVRIAEFPVHVDVARSAAEAGDEIVFGAPNVLRGGSHTGCPSAAEMVTAGCCSMLASDYYYPALLEAPFVLERRHGVSFPDAWALVSRTPALASGLADRGHIADGARADVILVEPAKDRPARVVAAVAGGRLAYLAEPALLMRAA